MALQIIDDEARDTQYRLGGDAMTMTGLRDMRRRHPMMRSVAARMSAGNDRRRLGDGT